MKNWKSVPEKHRKQKAVKKVTGSTAAVLCSTSELCSFIEFILCLHSFCNYSYQLEIKDEKNIDEIEYGPRQLFRYIDMRICRGDNTLDTRKTKFHT